MRYHHLTSPIHSIPKYEILHGIEASTNLSARSNPLALELERSDDEIHMASKRTPCMMNVIGTALKIYRCAWLI